MGKFISGLLAELCCLCCQVSLGSAYGPMERLVLEPVAFASIVTSLCVC